MNEPYYIQDKPEELSDPVKLAAIEERPLDELVAIARAGVALLNPERANQRVVNQRWVDAIMSDNP